MQAAGCGWDWWKGRGRGVEGEDRLSAVSSHLASILSQGTDARPCQAVSRLLPEPSNCSLTVCLGGMPMADATWEVEASGPAQPPAGE